MSSALLTQELVYQVYTILKPSIEQIVKIDPKRMVASIVAFDPAVRFGESESPKILLRTNVGEQDKQKWPSPYDEYAFMKTMVSWRTGLSSHLVQRDRPYLFRRGNFKFGGSIAFNGFFVGTSGLDWTYDLMISGMFATALYAASIGEFENELKKECRFIGTDETGAPDSD